VTGIAVTTVVTMTVMVVAAAVTVSRDAITICLGSCVGNELLFFGLMFHASFDFPTHLVDAVLLEFSKQSIHVLGCAFRKICFNSS
jgi:hypothetical protein